MPQWGRPSGARKGIRRKERDNRTGYRVDSRRFKEVDSDEEDGEGVGLELSFVSNELFFTGADSGSRPRNRRVHSRDYTSESSDDEDDSNDGYGGGMQMVLRDKEELLVQKALERIRRAQMLGRKNVILTKPEIDALARKRKRDGAVRKAAASSSRTAERRRSGVQLNETARDQRRDLRKNQRISTPLLTYDNGELPSPEVATPPGILIPGPDGNLIFQPFAPQTPSDRPSSSGSRSVSTHSHQQSRPSSRSSQLQQPEVRYIPISESSRRSSRIQPNPVQRRLPDDPNWMSRPRSASSQTYPPPLPQLPPQYAQGRRNVSGPPSMHSLGSRRGDPPPMPHASSEPSLLHREGYRHNDDDYIMQNDDTDDEDYGVPVDVVPYGQSYGIVERSEGVSRERPSRAKR